MVIMSRIIGGISMPFNVRDNNLILTTTSKANNNSLISIHFLLRVGTPVSVAVLNQSMVTFVQKTLLTNYK